MHTRHVNRTTFATRKAGRTLAFLEEEGRDQSQTGQKKRKRQGQEGLLCMPTTCLLPVWFRRRRKEDKEKKKTDEDLFCLIPKEEERLPPMRKEKEGKELGRNLAFPSLPFPTIWHVHGMHFMVLMAWHACVHCMRPVLYLI